MSLRSVILLTNQVWIIRALYFDGEKITPPQGTARWPVGPVNGNTMRPAMAMIVRDGRYIYSRPGDEQKELRFDFTDSDRGKYTWNSPVLVD